MNDEAAAKLAAQIAKYLGQQGPAQSQPSQTQPIQVQVGLPAQQVGLAPPEPSPVVTEVSVPLAIPLQDGRELAIRLHFAPEAAKDLQHLANWCAKAYGQYLAAKRPWSGKYNSNYDRDRYSDRGRRY